MDIHTEVINDDDGHGYTRRLFILFEGGRFAQPLVVLDNHQAQDLVAKYLGISRDQVEKLRKE